MRRTIRVLIVDDHFVSRQGTLALLHGAEDVEAGEAADGREAVLQAASLEPDVVLMDLAMPGMTGVEAIPRILERRPGTAIVVLTASVVEDEILGALRAGALGYLSKSTDAEEMARVIRQVHKGQSALPAAMTGKLFGRGRGTATSGHPPEEVTERERQVLRLIGDRQLGLGRREQAPEEGRRQDVLAAVDAPDRIDDLLHRSGLGHVAQGAGPHRLLDLPLVDLGAGHDQDAGFRPPSQDRAGGGDAVDLGHHQVHQHDVGLQPPRGLDRFPAVAGLPRQLHPFRRRQDRRRPASGTPRPA
jgi:DNA-binding NarL/FixJ family response regulator